MPLGERELRVRAHDGSLARFYLDALLGLMPMRTHAAERAMRREHEALLVEWSAREPIAGALGGGDRGGAGAGRRRAGGVAARHAAGQRPHRLAVPCCSSTGRSACPRSARSSRVAARQYPGLRSTTLRLLEPLGAPDEDTTGRGRRRRVRRGRRRASRSERGGACRPAATPSSTGRPRIAPGRARRDRRRLGRGQVEPGRAAARLASRRPPGGCWSMASRSTVPACTRCAARRPGSIRRCSCGTGPSLDNLRYGAPDAAGVAAVARSSTRPSSRRVLDAAARRAADAARRRRRAVSGGEGQRVRLGACADAPAPAWSILDEPFRGLDRARRRALLERAARAGGTAPRCCASPTTSARRSAFARVLVVDGGRIVEDGAPAELRGDRLALPRAARRRGRGPPGLVVGRWLAAGRAPRRPASWRRRPRRTWPAEPDERDERDEQDERGRLADVLASPAAGGGRRGDAGAARRDRARAPRAHAPAPCSEREPMRLAASCRRRPVGSGSRPSRCSCATPTRRGWCVALLRALIALPVQGGVAWLALLGDARPARAAARARTVRASAFARSGAARRSARGVEANVAVERRWAARRRPGLPPGGASTRARPCCRSASAAARSRRRSCSGAHPSAAAPRPGAPVGSRRAVRSRSGWCMRPSMRSGWSAGGWSVAGRWAGISSGAGCSPGRCSCSRWCRSGCSRPGWPRPARDRRGRPVQAAPPVRRARRWIRKTVRHEGAGHLLGQVIESTAIETLALVGALDGDWPTIELASRGASCSHSARWCGSRPRLLVALARARRARRAPLPAPRAALDRARLAHDPRSRRAHGRPPHAARAGAAPPAGTRARTRRVERYLGALRTRSIALHCSLSAVARGWLVVGLLGLAPALRAQLATRRDLAVGAGRRAARVPGARDGLGPAHRQLCAARDRLARQARPLFDAPPPRRAGRVTALAAALPVDVAAPRCCSRRTSWRSATASAAEPRAARLQPGAYAQGDRAPARGRLRRRQVDAWRAARRPARAHEGPAAARRARPPDARRAGWRRRVAPAPQFHENHVFTGTFAFNLLHGPRAGRRRRQDSRGRRGALRELGLGPLLERMPAGLQQMVGETGWQLSHGERSRLFIARALLQDADWWSSTRASPRSTRRRSSGH